jgi:hypothetical protein
MKGSSNPGQHLCVSYDDKYLFVNNKENNIDVFQLFKDRSQFVKTIEIKGGQIQCSFQQKKCVVIGCKDGNIYEIETDSG